jgi:AMP nucleosidase
MKKQFELKTTPDDTNSSIEEQIQNACDLMEAIYEEGEYPKVLVRRSWSKHNPIITGEMARPEAYRWYLVRELAKLAERGAEIKVSPSRERIALNDPELFANLDEDEWDITQKKLFLFSPERIDISLNRLEHYTGTKPKDFQRYILLTNYDMHVEVFLEKYPDCIKPAAAAFRCRLFIISCPIIKELH